MRRYIFIVLMACLMTGCKHVEYVTVPVEHTDTLIISKHQRDSIYVHDSTYIKEKGDTVMIERWHTRWRDRIVRDTIYKSKLDSIPYPVEVIKEVPAKLTWWQQTRLHLANILLWVIAIAGVAWVVRTRIKRIYGKRRNDNETNC